MVWDTLRSCAHFYLRLLVPLRIILQIAHHLGCAQWRNLWKAVMDLNSLTWTFLSEPHRKTRWLTVTVKCELKPIKGILLETWLDAVITGGEDSSAKARRDKVKEVSRYKEQSEVLSQGISFSLNNSMKLWVDRSGKEALVLKHVECFKWG